MKYGLEPNVSIYGFVENVHQLMAVSSCIIAKAGGLTLSEALALQVPVFIYRPFAGQEKENAVFLSKEGAAYISQHVEELALQISRFLSEPDLAEVMKRHMRRLHKKFASDAIARDILHSRSERRGARQVSAVHNVATPLNNRPEVGEIMKDLFKFP
jgi:processive 1,2-diacylglycerol beta-glucosyltransferase